MVFVILGDHRVHLGRKFGGGPAGVIDVRLRPVDGERESDPEDGDADVDVGIGGIITLSDA